MGKSTISMAIFNSELLVYQRVNVPFKQLIDLERTCCWADLLSMNRASTQVPQSRSGNQNVMENGHVFVRKACTNE